MASNLPKPGDQIPVKEDRGLFYVQLAGTAAMRPFVRTQAQTFKQTVTGFVQRSRLDVAINGNQYQIFSEPAIGFGGVKALFGGGAAADLTTPEGHVRGRGEMLAGLPEPNRFYVAWHEGRRPAYSFGFGNPPTDATASLGGLGPLIIDGLRYGVGNEYRADVPAGAAPNGEPAPEHRPFLRVRSNDTYAALNHKGMAVGKVVIAYSEVHDRLTIVVQRDGAAGIVLAPLRDQLSAEGAENAVFLDGSNSAMLYANEKFYVEQGLGKNIATTVGVGFQVR